MRVAASRPRRASARGTRPRRRRRVSSTRPWSVRPSKQQFAERLDVAALRRPRSVASRSTRPDVRRLAGRDPRDRQPEQGAARRSSARSRSPSGSSPGSTSSVYSAANAVSSPVVPIGACSNGTSFSWRACGAWSVAMQSIVPLRSASTSAWRSCSVRSGGFILKRLSSVRTTSSVSVRWCGVASRAHRAPDVLGPLDARRPTPRRRGAGSGRARARSARARRRARSSSTRRPTGCPPGRARAETAPSCITPSRDSAGSSSCSAITPPHRRWYWSALRSIPAETTGLPSSVKPSAPASRSAGHLGQLLALQAAGDRARNPTGTRASRRARSTSDPRIAASSTTGSVFGIAMTAQKPPAPRRRRAACRGPPCTPGRACAGARAGRRTPGTRACRWRRTARRPRAALSDPAAPSSAIRPSRIRTSCGSSRPARGSSTCAPRTSSSRRRDARGGWSRVLDQATAARHRRADQQLVEHRHPHRHAGFHLLADQRLRPSRSRRPTARSRG